jgi:RNA polymerase sigma factor (sigma-70 family)
MSISVARSAPFAGMPFSRIEQIGMSRLMNGKVDRPADGNAELVTLVAAVGAGDRAAFSALYRRTSAKLYGICLQLLRNEAEAQDALQEVFATVWQKAALFDPAKAATITWLAVLARNKAIDRLRRRTMITDDLDAAANVQDESASPFDVVGSEQDAARLNDCLDELEERARTMIRAAFLKGSTYPELAEHEGVPLGTMKSWIRRGLQRLRGCLER